MKVLYRYLIYLGLLTITLAQCYNAKAQFYNGMQMSFGKNRVQYKTNFWTYYRFDKFDVYFYTGGKQ